MGSGVAVALSVFVTGHVRSGTSMVAGLFARHGVFFGDCGRPTAYGPRGHFENRWLKTAVQDQTFTPEGWLQRLARDGWDGLGPWGAKLMPMHWWQFRHAEPSVVVCCYRDETSILASSAKMRWPRSHETVEDRWAIMRRIHEETEAAVFDVFTPDLIDGKYDDLRPAFDALGLTFDDSRAEAWIDPSLWHFRTT